MGKHFTKSVLLIALLLIPLSIVGCEDVVTPQGRDYSKGVQLVASTNQSKRLMGINHLEKASTDKAFIELEKLANDPDIVIRRAAIDAYIRGKKENALPFLITLLDETDEVLLGYIKDAIRAVYNDQQDVVLAIFNSQERDQKSKALKAMGITQDDFFIDILAMNIEDSANYQVQVAATEALGNYDSDIANKFLKKAFDSKYAKIKIIAIENLKKNGTPENTDLLIKTLSDPNHKIVEASVMALKENGNSDAVSALLEAANRQKSNKPLLESISKTLSVLAEDKNIPVITDYLSTSNKEIRLMIVRAAAAVSKKPWADEILAIATNNDMPEVASLALSSIDGETGDSTINALLQSLYDNTPEIRQKAIISLSKVPDAHHYRMEFERKLNDSNKNVKISTIHALGNVDSSWAIDFLEREFMIGEKEEVLAAAHGLTSFNNNARTAKILARKVGDKDSDVADAAAMAIGNLNNMWAKAILIDLLKHSSSTVRFRAIKALETMGDFSTVGALELKTKDPDKKVANAAMQAVKSIVKRKQAKDTMKSIYQPRK